MGNPENTDLAGEVLLHQVHDNIVSHFDISKNELGGFSEVLRDCKGLVTIRIKLCSNNLKYLTFIISGIF